MSAPEAVDLWRRSAATARRAVYLSIPIVHYPQASVDGNPHECHVVDDWNHERVLANFEEISDYWAGQEIGVYERRTDL
jgi:hypothetical protein